MNSALRTAKVLWAGMFAAAIIYVALPEIFKPTMRAVNPVIFIVLGFLMVSMLAAIILLRKIFIQKSIDTLRVSPNDTEAIARWRQGQIVTVAIAESIVLYGLVLRFIGASTLQAAPWYVVGIGALLVFRPRALD